MKIEKIRIKGFRNFKDMEVYLNEKTLIIGENNSGKTNLLYALRLLFDKSLSVNDLELTDTDYNVYSDDDKIEITATISDINEDCIISALDGNIKDERGIIQYTNTKDGNYKILLGFSEDVLKEVSGRIYINHLNMEFVNPTRDLDYLMKRERKNILNMAKVRREDKIIHEDKRKIETIQSNLDDINNIINGLSYMSTSLDQVNTELSRLAIQNKDQFLRFVAGSNRVEPLLENPILAYLTEENFLTLGGDGRKNQIFLATWATKQNISKAVDHITFYAIEEPEAHLHPHQQRKLSQYLHTQLSGQVIITSHSPHIASNFNPENIVRLYIKNKLTYVAGNGCSQKIKESFDDFSYRLNLISTETFFSSGVLLVEGDSEVLFYRSLAQALNIDLDYYNISIISVGGVGFKPYIAIYNSLNIPWVLRTDNDIFYKKTSKKFFFAGISRIIGILESINDCDRDILSFWKEHEKENEWSGKIEEPSEEAKNLNSLIREKVKPYGLYLSNRDLENDLARSPLKAALSLYYSEDNIENLIKKMQNRKAENMRNFLTHNQESLSILKRDNIAAPLLALKKMVEEREPYLNFQKS